MSRPRKNLPSICSCGETAWMRGGPKSIILVDASDIEILLLSPWHVNDQGYAQSKKLKRLHKVILPVPRDSFVDHRNQNKTDCRRENLRECSREENHQNRPVCKAAKRGPRSSRFKGVARQPRGGWMARIFAYGTAIHLGTFPDEKTAALAYDEAARKLHGEFAATNF